MTPTNLKDVLAARIGFNKELDSVLEVVVPILEAAHKLPHEPRCHTNVNVTGKPGECNCAKEVLERVMPTAKLQYASATLSRVDEDDVVVRVPVHWPLYHYFYKWIPHPVGRSNPDEIYVSWEGFAWLLEDFKCK